MAVVGVYIERLISRDSESDDMLGYLVAVVLAGEPYGKSLFTDRRMMWTAEHWFPWVDSGPEPIAPLRW